MKVATAFQNRLYVAIQRRNFSEVLKFYLHCIDIHPCVSFNAFALRFMFEFSIRGGVLKMQICCRRNLLVRLLEEQSRLMEGRVVFARQAFRVAKSWHGPFRPQVEIALKAMSTALWNFCFGGEFRSRNLEDDFYLATGFKLSLREHRLTNRNQRLKRMRSIEWSGSWYDITPHVKVPQKDADFRIHFALDWEQSVIVIGSCGPHLETSGSRLCR